MAGGGAYYQGYALAYVTVAVLALLPGMSLRCPVQPVIMISSFIGDSQNAQTLATEIAIKVAFDNRTVPTASSCRSISPLELADRQFDRAGRRQL